MKPRIVFLHYSAPPVVGGVEAVIAEQARLFADAGYPTLVVAGREADGELPRPHNVDLIPEIDSESPEYLEVEKQLERGELPPHFRAMQAHIQDELSRAISPEDVIIAHNVMSTHYNMALTAAIHEMLDRRQMGHLIAWCHDISRYVNPGREDVEQRRGFPWDLLRTFRPDVSYVAVSTARQRMLAGILHCPEQRIRVIPNGVDPTQLLGLSPLGNHLAKTFGLFDADLVVLMPVRITRVKNIEFAMRVAGELKRSGLVVRLVVTGPPDPHVPEIEGYFTGLKDMRRQLELEQDVIFIHDGTELYPSPLAIDAGIVGELYRVADLVLMPSRREGFGMPVLEAGMVDRTIFASAIPATDEIPGFEYLIRADESPESVAVRIRAWAHSDEAHKLRRRVRREFIWSSILTKRLIPLIERVATTTPGSEA